MTQGDLQIPFMSGQPVDAEGPIFAEAWEAQSFALTIMLHERGVFTWSEWADTLSQEIKRAQAEGDPDLGDTYYRHWMRALETILKEKGVTSSDQITSVTDAWHEAASITPHGQPIELQTNALDQHLLEK